MSPMLPKTFTVAVLNDRWRVLDDPLQWRLEKKYANPGRTYTGWRSKAYCRNWNALMRNIHEHCDGQIFQEGMDALRALPDWHVARYEEKI